MLTKEILRIKGTVLYTIAPEGRVWDAVGSMVDNDIGSLVVMHHGRLVGMLTFREVLAENPLGEEILASPAIAGGSLLLRTRSRLWRIR